MPAMCWRAFGSTRSIRYRLHTKAASPPDFSRSMLRARKYSCSDSPSFPAGSLARTLRSENGGFPTARSNVSLSFALVKSSLRTHASGYSSFAMRAVVGSISIAVIVEPFATASGISARNRPVPQPGSSTRPPVNPIRSSARQIARTTNSGVKCAYCVERARAAIS